MLSLHQDPHPVHMQGEKTLEHSPEKGCLHLHQMLGLRAQGALLDEEMERLNVRVRGDGGGQGNKAL